MVLKANELRIGNYIHNWGMGTPVLIDVRGYHMNDIEMLINHFESIPLDEEWLVKLGFYLKPNDAWFTLDMSDNITGGVSSKIRYSGGIVFWEQYLHQGFTKSKAAKIVAQFEKEHGEIEDDNFGMAMRENIVQVEIPIKHVHEMQNLIFSLTGKELTIKETV